jgi:hypothetical protein
MRLILGILAILLAIVFGLVEFRALADPTVAQTISNGFAVHDPFPRLPWITMSFSFYSFWDYSRVDCI